MTQQGKIMAAVDLTECSGPIVRYSVWLSMKLDMALMMVNVVNQRDLNRVQPAMTGDEPFSLWSYLDEQIGERRLKMQNLFQAIAPDRLKCHYIVQPGIPHRELLAAIATERPNLMVLGTKGRSNSTDFVVGSTARKLYRESPVPLITIPADFG